MPILRSPRTDRPVVLANDTIRGLTNPDALAMWVYISAVASDGRPVDTSDLRAHFCLNEARHRAAMSILIQQGLVEEVAS